MERVNPGYDPVAVSGETPARGVTVGAYVATDAQQVIVDWSAVPQIDTGRLETGNFKFSRQSENRAHERISQRELGSVLISLRSPGRETWLSVKLWDFSSISFGVLHKTEKTAWPAPAGLQETDALEPKPAAGEPAAKDSASTPGFKVGDEVEVNIKLPGDQEFRIWCQVKNISGFKGGTKIGLRRLDINFPQAVDIDRREAFRLPLAPSLALNARVAHPFIFGHWCPLRVSDVNRSMGLSFVSLDASILIFEGMELKIHFEIASHREAPMTARVAWVHATEANEVKFGVACMDMALTLHNGICEFLLFSRLWSPARLRQAGFRSQQVKNRLRFRSVKTMDDYAEVLYLRRDAYVGVGKKPLGTRPEEMAGNLDGQSRIMMAHHQDKLVGTLTFTFPTREDAVLDSQAGFPGQKYPVEIPPKANLIEVSRLCIHDEYRSTDLLQGMFEHGIKHFLLSDRHWLLTSAVADLLPIYQRIGFYRLKASYKHRALNNQEHHLLLVHRDAFLHGRGMNLLVWNTMFGELIGHLLGRGLIKVPGYVRAIIRFKLLFLPFSKRLLEKRARRAFKKHLDSLRAEIYLASAESPNTPD
ncbi:MAG: hypothetical protein ABIW76_07510 [Fibrobacteria bacterium]